jgi:hypothetical protein
VPGDSGEVILANTNRGRDSVVLARLGPDGWVHAGTFPRSSAGAEDFASVRRGRFEEVWYWPEAHPDTIIQVSRTAESADHLVLHPVPVDGMAHPSSMRAPRGSSIVVADRPTLLARAVADAGLVRPAAFLVEIDAEGAARLRREWPACPGVSGPTAILPGTSASSTGRNDGSLAGLLWQANGAAFTLASEAPQAPPPDLAFTVSLWSNIADRTHDGVESPLVDLDGDGRVDLLYQDENWQYQMRPGIGEPPWFGSARLVEGIPESTELFAAELDGDPGTELLAWSGGSEPYLTPLFRMADGTGFQAGTTVPTSWALPTLGDFDGDGRDEVYDPSSVSFVRWRSDGVAEAPSPARWVASRVLGAADFDGDGRDELIANPTDLIAWQTADPVTGDCSPLAYTHEQSWLWGTPLQCVPDRPVEICTQRIFETVQLVRAGTRSTERRGRDLSVDKRSWPGPPSTEWWLDEAADLEADGQRAIVMHWYAEPGWVAVLRDPWGAAHYEIGLLPEVPAGIKLYQEAGLHWTDLDGDGAEDLVVLRLDGVRTVLNPVFRRMTGHDWHPAKGPEVRLLSANPGKLPLSLAVRLRRPGDIVLSLFDVSGRRVYTVDDRVTTTAWSQVDVDPRPGISLRGVYWLQVRGEEGETSRKVIVINHSAAP